MRGAEIEEHSVTRKRSRKARLRYRWFTGAPLREGKDALSVNWIGLAIADASGKTTYNGAFVTSLDVSSDNVAEIAACARARWKIENESFNVLKNNGYHLEHNFGHGKQNLAMMFAAMNLLAFAFHTVCESLEALWTKARLRQTRQNALLRTHANHHRLSRLSRLANPHDHPHHLKTAPRNRKTNPGLKSPRGTDLELLMTLLRR